ncbi:N-6 DNA methylase [Parasutterella excrementihominis]
MATETTAKRGRKPKTTQPAKVDFKKQLWTAANAMRGNLDAGVYKHVLLGLIFLKYISEKFEERFAQIAIDYANEDEKFIRDAQEDPDEYIAENVFWVPQEARWSKIASMSTSASIGMTIDAAMRAIEAVPANIKLKGILPKNYASQDLDQRMLGKVVDLFSNINLGSERQNDLLGEAYMYCLKNFAAAEGTKAGQFYTPVCIVKTLVNIIEPFNGRVGDPCCGSGGMFVQSVDFIEKHRGSRKNISVYGEESNPVTWKLAMMNMAIHGIDANLGDSYGNTFFDDKHAHERMDYFLANPPFNQSEWRGEELEDDPRWEYGIPSDSNANFAWMQHMIHHLSQRGRIGMVLANGSLTSTQNNEGEIRRRIIEADLVEGIVALPDKLFTSTGIPCSLWFLNKAKDRPKTTLFVDARNMGTMVSRALRELTEEDIEKLATIFREYRSGTLENQKGFTAVITNDEIQKQDFVLTPGRYVGMEEQNDYESFDENITKLTTELAHLFEKSHDLEEKIRANLKGLGYEI